MERGLEFYVMLAAVAVGALTWLYKKGSCAAPFGRFA